MNVAIWIVAYAGGGCLTLLSLFDAGGVEQMKARMRDAFGQGAWIRCQNELFREAPPES